MAWTDHATALLEGMPSRRRAAVEAVFVAALSLAGLVESWAAAGVLLVVGAAVVAPWRMRRPVFVRIAACAGLVVTILVPVVLAEAMHGAMAGSRRIGISIEAVEARPGDPPADGGILEVGDVEPKGPADGLLRKGDRIVSLDGGPLDRTAPSRDLVARMQTVGEEATLGVVRDQRLDAVKVPVPRAVAGPSAWRALGRFGREHILAAAVLRAICVIGLVLLLLGSDGQRVRTIGLERRGLGLDVLVGLALTLGAFGVMLASGLLVQGIAFAFHSHLVEQEGAERPTMLLDLFGGTSLAVFAASIAVTATFEEVVFRGFLMPRLRHATGSWGAAIAIASVAFGAGHLYEGWTAVVQTCALGVFFGFVLLLRGRLVPAIVAHASFDVTVFAFLTWLQRSGWLDRAREMLEKH